MADVKWIKITTDLFDDEKVLLIESLPSADSIIVIWFKLLTLAGKQNNNGVLMFSDRIAYTEEMLSAVFRRDINLVKQALEVFEQFGMIERYQDVITIPNWNKHQNLDTYEKRKAQDRLRKQQRRLEQKRIVDVSEECQQTVRGMSADCPSTVGVSEEEEDIEHIDKSICIGKTQKKFSKPSIEEVTSYCKERNNSVDPQRFIDYYDSNGWMVGRNKMKDWKAAVRNWEKSNNSTDNTPKTKYEPCPICGHKWKQRYDKSYYCYNCHKEY